MSQMNMYVRSTAPYQEGCVQASVDGRKIWLSSGLEDYFLGSYFHSMPQLSLPLTGFQLSNSSVCAVLGFEQKFALKDAIESHACWLEASMHATHTMPPMSTTSCSVHFS
jgi:hypothetical protein